jgi:hypothetical protein
MVNNNWSTDEVYISCLAASVILAAPRHRAALPDDTAHTCTESLRDEIVSPYSLKSSAHSQPRSTGN